MVIDNGADRVDAAWTFVQWLTAPEQVLADSLATGHLPTRTSVETMPGFPPSRRTFPGVDVFAQNLVNVKKARPSIATYPQVSQLIGNAVTSVAARQGDAAGRRSTTPPRRRTRSSRPAEDGGGRRARAPSSSEHGRRLGARCTRDCS